MRAAVAKVLIRSAAAWLGILTVIAGGIAVFGEPDNGVMNTSAWIGKAVVAAIAALAGGSSVSLWLLCKAGRLVAVPVLIIFGILSGASVAEGMWHAPLVLSEWRLSLAMFISCAVCLAVLLRRATWSALDIERG
jgi:hypothetical protein